MRYNLFKVEIKEGKGWFRMKSKDELIKLFADMTEYGWSKTRSGSAVKRGLIVLGLVVGMSCVPAQVAFADSDYTQENWAYFPLYNWVDSARDPSCYGYVWIGQNSYSGRIEAFGKVDGCQGYVGGAEADLRISRDGSLNWIVRNRQVCQGTLTKSCNYVSSYTSVQGTGGTYCASLLASVRRGIGIVYEDLRSVCINT
jgi:hypothetical protein